MTHTAPAVRRTTAPPRPTATTKPSSFAQTPSVVRAKRAIPRRSTGGPPSKAECHTEAPPNVASPSTSEAAAADGAVGGKDGVPMDGDAALNEPPSPAPAFENVPGSRRVAS